MRAFNVHDGFMSANKGVQRRSRVAKRNDLVEARWRIPKEIKEEAEQAAKASGLSEALYVDLLLRQVAKQHGGLPRFAANRLELPILDVA